MDRRQARAGLGSSQSSHGSAAPRREYRCMILSLCEQVVAGTNYKFNFMIMCGKGATTPKYFQAECFEPLPSAKKTAAKISSVVMGTA